MSNPRTSTFVSPHTGRVPNRCIETKPTAQSIQFCQTYINLTVLSAVTGTDHGYLSRIFRGQRIPSVTKCTVLAEALGMTLVGFMYGLEGIRAVHLAVVEYPIRTANA
jgi:hypothetical protein